jgi:hypothetical protein
MNQLRNEKNFAYEQRDKQIKEVCTERNLLLEKTNELEESKKLLSQLNRSEVWQKTLQIGGYTVVVLAVAYLGIVGISVASGGKINICGGGSIGAVRDKIFGKATSNMPPNVSRYGKTG